MSRKFSAENIVSSFPQITEFKGLNLKTEHAQYIADCLNRISKYEDRLNELLMHFEIIDSPVKIRFGTELEFYNIAGEDSFDQRLTQIKKTRKIAKEDPGKRYEEILGKDDSYMPKPSQHVNLNQAFFTKIAHAQHVQIDREPAYKQQTATEAFHPRIDQAAKRSFVAMFQHEVVSPPRSPYGLGLWLAAIAQRIINQAPRFGLERSEIISSLHDEVSTSGLHVHMSVIGLKGGKEVNIFQRDNFQNEKGNRRKNPAEVSQLAIHTAYALNQFLKDNIYIFAPTSNSYVRFRHAVSTSRIGFAKRRVNLDQGSAMFRGEGRETFREEDTTGKPDTGPLRIELRAADVCCIGHPNKVAYQDQIMAPFDVVESLVYVLAKGVENWAKDRERELKGGAEVLLTESALYEQRFDLPRWVGEAADILRESQKRGDGFLTAERVETITTRGHKQQEINDLDRNPRFERGQTIDRNGLLSMIHSRAQTINP